LVPKSVTLNGIMAFILHYFTVFGSFRAHYVKVVEKIHLFFLQWKCSPKNLDFSDISFMAIFAEVTDNNCIIHSYVCDVDSLSDLVTHVHYVVVFS